MIDFKNVSMTYRESGVQALKDVSFHIDPGEFCFIIGESGAGKSTLIKLLTREQKPESGQIRILGYDVAKFKERQVPYLRRNIGMVFQDFRLIDTKTVYENVAYAMEIVGASRRQIQRQVPLVLSTVGLRQKAKMRPHELSGGEQQRVAIARALVNSPMMLLADEPTGNLDPETSEAIMVLLSVINRAGTTVIICTHDRDLVDRMQRRVIEIRDG
ncbi:MAG: cell division ATP-binding protein FtsE, partial [Eubacteriales bacterium]|nr:cell division ATP-binding protein FtsE [Eubacteriales bacterium]